MFLQREYVSCVWLSDSKCPHPGGEASWSPAHSHLERDKGEEGEKRRERRGGREEEGEKKRRERRRGGREEEGGKRGGGKRGEEGEKRREGREESGEEEQWSKAHEHLLVCRFCPECLATFLTTQLRTVTTDHQVY